MLIGLVVLDDGIVLYINVRSKGVWGLSLMVL